MFMGISYESVVGQSSEQLNDSVDIVFKEVEAKLPEILEDINARFSEKLPFHSADHTEEVFRRAHIVTSKINEAFSHNGEPLTEAEVRVVATVALTHDYDQVFNQNGTQRLASDHIKMKLLEIDDDTSESRSLLSLRRLFPSLPLTDLERSAMAATIAVFDHEAGLIQPGLDEYSIEAESGEVIENKVFVTDWIIALADLGSAGLDEPEQFHRMGNRLFIEMNPDFMSTITKLVEGGNVADESIDMLNSYINWHAGQRRFIEQRRSTIIRQLSNKKIYRLNKIGEPIELTDSELKIFRDAIQDVHTNDNLDRAIEYEYESERAYGSLLAQKQYRQFAERFLAETKL